VKQEIRIIAGLYRGKKLGFPVVDGLRPTPDRVRETLFNWLMHDIRGARCLDAFAGSGALGFEALSRHAASVVLVEQSEKAHENLVKLAKLFPSSGLQVLKGDACQYIRQTTEQFDIIFLDPPFSKNYLAPCIKSIAESGVLADHGLLYIESPVEEVLDPQIWRQLKFKKSGQVAYGLYQKTPAPLRQDTSA